MAAAARDVDWAPHAARDHAGAVQGHELLRHLRCARLLRSLRRLRGDRELYRSGRSRAHHRAARRPHRRALSDSCWRNHHRVPRYLGRRSPAKSQDRRVPRQDDRGPSRFYGFDRAAAVSRERAGFQARRGRPGVPCRADHISLQLRIYAPDQTWGRPGRHLLSPA